MQTYIAQHIRTGSYIDAGGKHAPYHQNVLGWSDYAVSDQYLFSHRVTHYRKENFRDEIHSHDFFEIIIYIGGDVQYISENDVVSPSTGDVILSSPGRMHAARLLLPSLYERYVLQFKESIFDRFGTHELLAFLREDPSRCFISPPPEHREAMLRLLANIETVLREDHASSRILAMSYTIQLFDYLGRSLDGTSPLAESMPKNVRKIKEYIDTNFNEIVSSGEVAQHFYYSREYVSRLFKRYFNTTISHYITLRKINESKRILAKGGNVTDACYSSGFRNMSSYIKSFTAVCGVTPARYKRSILTHN